MGFLTTDSKCENFLLEIPFHLNSLVQHAPSRRFLKKKGAWFLQGLRLNAEYVRSTIIPDSNIEIDDRVYDLIEKILAKTAVREIPFPAWYRFKPTVFPMEKQLEALNKSWGKNFFCFAMDRGTGKTKVYIETGTALFLDGQIEAMVILTKNTVTDKIIKEVGKHCPLEAKRWTAVVPILNSKPKKREARSLIDSQPEILKILSMGIESFSVGEQKGNAFEFLWDFVAVNKTAIFVDESHMIKTPSSIRTKNITAIGGMCTHRYVGSGTLSPAGLLDLYSQYQFLSQDIVGIGNYYSFKHRYAVMGGFENKEVVGYDNVEELMTLLRPWTFQVSKEEMVDLPPKIFTEPIIVQMTAEQKKIYNDIKKKKAVIINDILDSGENLEIVVEEILQIYALLRQVATGFISYDDEDGKRQRQWITPPEKNPKYKELIYLLESNPKKPFTFWTCHLMELHAVHKLLNEKGFPIGKFHGAMTREERIEALDDFETGRVPHLIATPGTGGTGLDFIHSSDVVYISNSNKFIDRAQSEDRNHRKGTINKVVYTDIIMAGTPDEDVRKALAQHQDLSDYIEEQLKDKYPLTTL